MSTSTGWFLTPRYKERPQDVCWQFWFFFQCWLEHCNSRFSSRSVFWLWHRSISFSEQILSKPTKVTATQLFASRFYKCLELALEAPSSADTSPEERGKNHAVYTRRRKRKTIQEQEAHTSPKDHSEEPEPADDTETNLGIFAELMV